MIKEEDGPLEPRLNSDGCLEVDLVKGSEKHTCLVAHLVLETFVGPCPSGYRCNYKDGNKQNTKLENLEWVPEGSTDGNMENYN